MQGRLSWVFGASGILGTALVEELLEKDYSVIAFVHSSTSVGYHTNSKVNVIAIDLNLVDEAVFVVANTATEYGRPHSIFFCSRGEVIADSQLEDFGAFDQIISDYKIAVLSPIVISHHAITHFDSLHAIVFVSSQYAIVGQDSSIYENPSQSISTSYCSHKGAIISAARNISIQAAKKEVFVNTVTLGGLLESTDPRLRFEIEKRLPSAKMLTARRAASFILGISEQSSCGLVGENVVLDMGWTIQ
jgi:NAD(P)-dependent dehydrogenase (short-subunit alcohol dehydrogenase family)